MPALPGLRNVTKVTGTGKDDMTTGKKLIEVALPLDAINKASAREKSIRHGHPSTLHLWWARRPLAAARAVIFAQMVDDPSAYEPDEAKAERERKRLFAILEDLVLWENTTNEAVLQRARDAIRQSWRRTCAANAGHPRAGELFNPDRLPAFHDPFAGGGALPLEAQRLGLESYASDLNPVAVLINKAMIEIPPRFAGKPPVNPESRRKHLGAPTPPEAVRTHLGARASRPHKAWHSRGYLPHLDQPGAIQSLTFRLSDSVPADIISHWKRELALTGDEAPDDPRCAELRERIERYADQGHGACWLRDERIASRVEEALFHFDGVRYRLLAWVVMPNHVHALIETLPDFPLADIIHSWKSYTAKQANKTLKRTGAFWMPDYFDCYVRDEQHLAAVATYIEQNPVKAGLVRSAGDWQWSSASGRQAGGTPALPGFWAGARGLAEDVRYYGQWMRDEAEKRIGWLYPKVAVTAEMAQARPDLEPYVGRELTVIAWLWARTVKSPNPAFAHVDVPLASTFMLSTKKGKEAYVEPVIENGGYRFTVRMGAPADAEAAKAGTTAGKRRAFRCLMSGVPVTYDHIRVEGKAGRMGARMMAVVAEGDRGRIYLEPLAEHEAIAFQADPEWKPDVELPVNPRDFKTPNYGMRTFADLFTARQLVALTTFSDLVQEAREQVRRDAVAAGIPDDGEALRVGGAGATAYAEAVGVYLGMSSSRAADAWSTITSWRNGVEATRGTFARQALPMVWDYAEANPLSSSSGNWIGACLSWVAEALDFLPQERPGAAVQGDAARQTLASDAFVSTDPPYYDNIGYADLSDFFYVWLRRTLRSVLPDLFATLAVPKAEELVATPYRHGSKEKAEAFFLDGMTQAVQRLVEQTHPGFPVTIYYAFKQSETTGDAGAVSTGWETFLGAVIEAGFAITGTWPIRTERGARSIGIGSNALASSIVLVCRKRPTDAPWATRREFVSALKTELPAALVHLQRGNIAPVDLAQAAIGPGMAIYTRYAKVLDTHGQPLPVRDALALINQTLDEVLAEQEGDFDADTRWALAWFEQAGFDEGDYGVAETLSKAKNTSVDGLVEAGVLVSRGGKVRLLKPDELAGDWNPTTDPRLTAWETVHYLVHTLESDGESAAAELTAALGSTAETARELCYRLYTLCERKKRAAEALSYNALVQSWPEIARLAQERQSAAVQATLFPGTEG